MAGKKKHKLAALIFLSVFLVSCALSYDAKGRYHKVQQGENIWKIANAYRVSVQDLAELNNIQDGKSLTVGQKLYLPPHKTGLGYKKIGKRTVKIESEGGEKEEPIYTDHSKYIWPVDGKLMSGFGIRNGRRHDGIDIAAKEGTPIKAAANGKVVFADKLRGYGNLVIIKHDDDFFTVYGHNEKNLVKKEKKVKKGDIIAYVGQTGRATGPHVHFEIRNRQKARNPLFFLPPKKG